MVNCYWKEGWSQHETYDLLVANIIDGVLLDLKSQFQQAVSPGSRLVFSGVLAERETDFLSEMTDSWPLELLERRFKDEWLSFSFRVL